MRHKDHDGRHLPENIADKYGLQLSQLFVRRTTFYLQSRSSAGSFVSLRDPSELKDGDTVYWSLDGSTPFWQRGQAARERERAESNLHVESSGVSDSSRDDKKKTLERWLSKTA
ncbi:hypothetical protein CYMTET_27480, partial [Cymbomonas tetramitiformis]